MARSRASASSNTLPVAGATVAEAGEVITSVVLAAEVGAGEAVDSGGDQHGNI